VRAVVNLSPEPVSNAVTSVAEDGLVLGGLALIGLFPTIALFVFIGIVILCSAFAIWLWKRIVRMRRQSTPAQAET
jgi:predicted lipid-binding transport protein (Tim44 family)